jgi:hypothetical protein
MVIERVISRQGLLAGRAKHSGTIHSGSGHRVMNIFGLDPFYAERMRVRRTVIFSFGCICDFTFTDSRDPPLDLTWLAASMPVLLLRPNSLMCMYRTTSMGMLLGTGGATGRPDSGIRWVERGRDGSEETLRKAISALWGDQGLGSTWQKSFADSNQNKCIAASVASTCTTAPSWTLSDCSLPPNIRPPSSSGQPRHTWPQSRRPCLCLCTFRLGGFLLLPSRQDFQRDTPFLWQQSPACGSMCIQEAKSARDLRIRSSLNISLSTSVAESWSSR